MKRRFTLIALLCLAIAPAAAQQVQLPYIPTVQVPPGSSGTQLNGQLKDGAQALYYVSGTAGQTMSVSVSSPGNVAVFIIYEPGTYVRPGPNIRGKTIKDAGPSDGAAAWVGALPKTGPYLLVVANRGGIPGPYNLAITMQ